MDFPVHPIAWNGYAAVKASRTSQGSLVTSYRRSSNYVLLHILSEYELYHPDCVGRPGDPETIRSYLRSARWTRTIHGAPDGLAQSASDAVNGMLCLI
jgi:hypothetical protein